MTDHLIELRSLDYRDRTALRQLILQCLRADPRHPPDRLTQLIRGAPLRALPAASRLHRVAGTVRNSLDAHDAVPPSIIEELDSIVRQSVYHHLLMVGALSEIAGALDEAGLRWAAMKGPVVAAVLYQEIGGRAYGDLDLLVSRTDFAEAMAVLEHLGYRSTVKNWRLAESMLAGQVGMRNERLPVDLHWHLHYSVQDRRDLALDPEGMLERLRRVDVTGVSTPTLDPVDTLITLAFHGARSGGHALVWLKDIERSLAVDTPDFDEVVRRSHWYRCAPAVGLMLDESRTLLGADVPEQVVRALVPIPLRTAYRFVTTFTASPQLHEGTSVQQALMRSMRADSAATLSAIPVRALRQLRDRFRPPTENEADDPTEKSSYLAAVAAATEP